MESAVHLSGPVLRGIDDIAGQAWVVDGRITYDPPPAGTEVRELAGWVIPGLVDAHCHVGLGREGAVDRESAQAQARTDADHGTLLIRDAGSPADTRWIDERDDLPKIIRAGRHIARTKRYIRNYADEVEPEQLVSRVIAQARAGDGWVKLVGDWIDRDLGDLAPCWPREVLADAIAAAHAEGARVTAHCFGEESLYDFAAAGTDCIEHACGLEPETIASFAAQGIAIVPTLVNIDTFPQIAEPAREKFPTYYAHMIDLYHRRLATIGAAHEAGVPVYLGTDAGGSLAHGLAAQEAQRLLAAGLTARDVLHAASYGARAWLGRPVLAEGDPADLLVLASDPREDLTTLLHPAAVVLRGRQVA